MHREEQPVEDRGLLRHEGQVPESAMFGQGGDDACRKVGAAVGQRFLVVTAM